MASARKVCGCEIKKRSLSWMDESWSRAKFRLSGRPSAAVTAAAGRCRLQMHNASYRGERWSDHSYSQCRNHSQIAPTDGIHCSMSYTSRWYAGQGTALASVETKYIECT